MASAPRSVTRSLMSSSGWPAQKACSKRLARALAPETREPFVDRDRPRPDGRDDSRTPMTTCTIRSARSNRAIREKSCAATASGRASGHSGLTSSSGQPESLRIRPLRKLHASLLVTKLGDMKVNTGDSPGLQGPFGGDVPICLPVRQFRCGRLAGPSICMDRYGNDLRLGSTILPRPIDLLLKLRRGPFIPVNRVRTNSASWIRAAAR